MKQILLKNLRLRALALMALLCALFTGTAWGEEVTFSYGDYKGKGTQSSGSEYTMEKTDISITDTKFYGNTSYAHFYANGVTTITPASGVTITKIVLTASASGYNGFQSGGTVTPSTGSVSANGATVTWTGSATSTFTISHNKQIRWTSIVVTYTKSSGTETCTTPTFNPAAGAVAAGTEVTISCSTPGASIYYTTDGSTPSSTNGTQGTSVTINATCTVKAIAVKTGAEDSEIATAEYTIKQTISGLTIDFESDVDCYSDWTMVNIGNSNTAISAHGGSKYGANINDGGNGVEKASITTKAKVANPTTFTCYVSKTSSNSTSSTWYVEVSPDSSTWTEVKSQSATSMSKGEWTEVTANLGTYKNVYVRLRYDGSTAIRAVDDISIVEGGKMTATVALDKTSLNIGETATVTTDGPAVTLSTSDANVASVSGTTVTAVAAGTATITATWAENDEFEGGSEEFTVTVTDPNGPGTENNPYTVAQARAAIDAGTGITGVYATGIVSEIVTAYDSQYGNITYNISADGTTTADQLQAYRGKSYNGNNFTSEDDIQVGDEVVIFGNLKKYENSTTGIVTYEFDSNNQLVSLIRPEKPKHQASFYVNGEVSSTFEIPEDENITFPTNPADIEGKTFVGWTANEIEGTQNVAPEMVTTAKMGTKDVSYYAVFASMIEGTEQLTSMTINANTENIPSSYAASKDYELNGTTFNITQVYKNTSNVLQWRAAGNAAGTGTMYNQDALSNIQSIVITYAAADSNKNFTVKVGSSANPTSGSSVTATVSGSVYTFDCSENNCDFFVLTNGTGAGYLSSVVINYIQAAPASYSDYCTTVTTPAITVTLNGEGYATFSSTQALDFTNANGYTAWQVTDVEGTSINFEQIDGAVAAGTGILLKGPADEEITLTSAAEGVDISNTNKLVAITVATYIEAYQYYGLSGKTFVKVKAGTVKAGKALLPASVVESTGSDVKALSFNFGGIVTGIDSMNADNNAEIYNLAGQRVEKMQKGIYVVGGKKMLVK